MKSLTRMFTPDGVRLTVLAVAWAAVTSAPIELSAQDRPAPSAEQQFQRRLITIDRSRIEALLGGRLASVPFATADSAGNAAAVPADSFEVQPGELFAAALDDSVVVETDESGLRIDLPVRYMALNEDLTPLQSLRLRALIDGGGLRLNRETGTFRGVMRVWLDDSLNPGRPQAIFPPAVFHIASAADRVEPNSITISETVAVYQIVLETRPPRVQLVPVQIIGGGRDMKFDIPVLLPKLELFADRKKLTGFGLATALVTVQVPPDAADRPVPVILSASQGEISPSHLNVSSGTWDTLKVRSAGIGWDTLVVTSLALEDGVLVLHYTWPISYAMATLIGALLGAIFSAQRSRAQGVPGGRSMAAKVFANTVSGVIVSIAYSVGLNLTGVEMPVGQSEAAVFVAAAIGAIVGVPVLTKLLPARRTEGTLTGIDGS